MIFVYIAIYIEGASLLFNDVCVHSIYIEGASLLCNDICIHSYIY